MYFFHAIHDFISNKKSQSGQTLATMLLFLLAIFCCFCSDSLAASLSDYRFSADDEISITVFGEPDLSLARVRISINGTVAIPLIGQVYVQGLTAVETEKKITKLFSDGYLKNPDITVSIIEYRQFYIKGEVQQPGGYSYREGLTVEKAVVLAGGFTERASQKKITIAHDNTDNATHVELSTPIQPGDIITVEESFF